MTAEFSTDQQFVIDHRVPAQAGSDQDGHSGCDTQTASADLIAQIREHNRRRNDMHREERALTLRIKAICRRFCDGDKGEAAKLYAAVVKKLPHPHVAACAAWVMPLLLARVAVASSRKADEKIVEKQAKLLAVWPWCAAVRGFGALSLGQVVGEAGDIGSYGNPAKLWKRMGLAVFDGKSQRRVTDADDAIRQGYSPHRRSLMFVIGDNLIRARNSEYSAIYAERKAYELARAPDMKPLHAHRRAKRYMEKRLLRELWRAWRAAKVDMTPGRPEAPANQSPE